MHGNKAVLVRLENRDAVLDQQLCDVRSSLEASSVLLDLDGYKDCDEQF